jgi:hypothetical protein
MRNRLILVLFSIVFLSGVSFAFTQNIDQNDMPQQQTKAPQPPISKEEIAENTQEMPAQGGAVASLGQNEPEVFWVWGEVAAVDLMKKSLTLKYLDYENDEEKEISISVDGKTSFEFVRSLDEIKAKSVVSIDYIVQDGLNIAKNISFERGELPIPGGELNLDDANAMSPAVP